MSCYSPAKFRQDSSEESTTFLNFKIVLIHTRPGAIWVNGTRIYKLLKPVFIKHFKHADYKSGC